MRRAEGVQIALYADVPDYVLYCGENRKTAALTVVENEDGFRVSARLGRKVVAEFKAGGLQYGEFEQRLEQAISSAFDVLRPQLVDAFVGHDE